jgi:ABC-type protease/lipase transport system fused ATPase/permease subunit
MAHALYRARDLLLLDEASGQLDSTSERALIDAIRALPDDLSVVLVSHGPALFGCCHIVYELADGQLRPCSASSAPV